MLIGVFGTGRNGSSLICRLLDGLGDTYVHPVEEKFLTAFEDISKTGRVTRLVEQNCTVKSLKNLDRIVDSAEFSGYYNSNSLSEIHEHCQTTIGPPSNLGQLSLNDLVGETAYTAEEFTRKYLDQIARVLRPDIEFKHHLFKTIETAYIETYEKYFPEMRFIHIMRHPVAVCSSQKKVVTGKQVITSELLRF